MITCSQVISTIFNVSSKLCASSSSVLRSGMQDTRGHGRLLSRDALNMTKRWRWWGIFDSIWFVLFKFDSIFFFFRKTVALLPEQDEEQVIFFTFFPYSNFYPKMATILSMENIYKLLHWVVFSLHMFDFDILINVWPHFLSRA